MQPKALYILLSPLLLIHPASAGINCEGSSQCAGVDPVLPSLVAAASNIDSGRWYENGQHIVCEGTNSLGGGICAFLKNTGGAPGSSIKTLLEALEHHGCNNCGSVPLYYPDGDNNDADHGVLTVDFVTNSCEDVC